MKLRVIISFLFIIATLAISLHEIEHITGEHESASCQICIIDDHTSSSDIIDTFEETIIVSFDVITLKYKGFTSHLKISTNHSNAPPLLS